MVLFGIAIAIFYQSKISLIKASYYKLAIRDKPSYYRLVVGDKADLLLLTTQCQYQCVCGMLKRFNKRSINNMYKCDCHRDPNKS